jgi:hypothetical protein
MTPCHCEQNHACQSLARRCADCPVLQSAAPVEALQQPIEYWTVALDKELAAGLVG